MAHRESNDGITVAETFDRRESIADYLDELVTPAPAGRLVTLQVGDLPLDWLEDYIAAIEQRGMLTGPPRIVSLDQGRVYTRASGAWPAPTSRGSVTVLLSSQFRAATAEDFTALAVQATRGAS